MKLRLFQSQSSNEKIRIKQFLRNQEIKELKQNSWLIANANKKILFSKINLSQKSDKWAPSEPKEVTRPEFDWEGANLPLQKSARSSINMPVNQLRDPFIFKEKENVYMFYAVKGESGIAFSKLAKDSITAL